MLSEAAPVADPIRRADREIVMNSMRFHWREVRDETKFGRMLYFSEILQSIRERVEHDIEEPVRMRAKRLRQYVERPCARGVRSARRTARALPSQSRRPDKPLRL